MNIKNKIIQGISYQNLSINKQRINQKPDEMMENDKPIVTALLLNYNRPYNIPKIIKSLRSQSIPVNIVLCNNGDHNLKFDADTQMNTDNSLRCFTRWEACRSVTTEYAFSFDDDQIIVNNNLLFDCISVLKRMPEDSMIGPYGVKIIQEKPYKKCKHIKFSDEKIDIVKGRMIFTRTSTIMKALESGKHEKYEDDILISSFSPLKRSSKLFAESLKDLDMEGGVSSRREHFKNRTIAMNKYFNKKLLDF